MLTDYLPGDKFHGKEDGSELVSEVASVPKMNASDKSWVWRPGKKS